MSHKNNPLQPQNSQAGQTDSNKPQPNLCVASTTRCRPHQAQKSHCKRSQTINALNQSSHNTYTTHFRSF